MATKKKATETRTKAAVGRERRLALALRALLDSLKDVTIGEDRPDAITEAEIAGDNLLDELGYGTLESVPVRVARLEAELAAAMEAKDGKLIAELGRELDRAQQGLPPSKAKATAAAAGEKGHE